MRAALLHQLRAQPPGAGAAVCAAVADWLAARPGLRTVAAYAALPGEVDLLPLLERFPERRWVLPRVAGDDLRWFEVREAAHDLVPGGYGIREPRLELPEVTAAEVEVFLCPGLGFDPAGGRLGRGRGYYDRTLARAAAEVVRVGVCHPFQRVPSVYAEPHDVPMHLVIDGT